MTRFPYKLSELNGGIIKLSFIELPRLRLFGRSHYVLRLESAWALNAFISTRIRKRLHIPKPTKDDYWVPLEESLDFRLILYWQMCDSGYDLEDFARALDLSPETVENILDGEESECPSPYIEAIASQENLEKFDSDVLQETSPIETSEGAQLALLAV